MSTVYWLTRSESDLPADADWLAPGEVAVVSRLTMPKRERDWLLGRWTAKQALAALPGPHRLSIRPSDFDRLEIRCVVVVLFFYDANPVFPEIPN